MTELIGRKLGKYEVQEYIGGGGMADVYRGYHAGLGKSVAIKVLKPDRSSDPAFVQAFVNEAKTAAHLSHPHIVTIHDVGEQDGVYYIVMEYVSGQSLQKMIRTLEGLPPKKACELFGQIAEALDHAHSHGFVHCDVKPSNILLDAEGRVKLTDFGIARAAAQIRAEGEQKKRIGSPRYMSPEHAQGQPLDHRSDIYSLGIVLFEMLTGHVPFDAGSSSQILKAQVMQRPPPPSTVKKELPKAVDEVVLRALAKDPEKRYQNALQMAQDLKRVLLPGVRVPPPPVAGPSAAAVPPSRRLPVALLAAGGVIMVLLIAAVLFRSRPGVGGQATPTRVSPSSTLLPTLGETIFPTATPKPPEGPTSTLQPTKAPMPTQTPVRAPATPTSTHSPTPRVPPVYAPPAPELLEPAEGAGISGETIPLRWSWSGTLKGDEYFDLWVWPRGEAERRNQLLKSVDVHIYPPGGVGVYFWKVRIVKGEPTKPEAAVPVSPWSAVRSFDYKGRPQPPPEPSPLPTRP